MPATKQPTEQSLWTKNVPAVWIAVMLTINDIPEHWCPRSMATKVKKFCNPWWGCTNAIDLKLSSDYSQQESLTTDDFTCTQVYMDPKTRNTDSLWLTMLVSWWWWGFSDKYKSLWTYISENKLEIVFFHDLLELLMLFKSFKFLLVCLF